MKFPGRKVCRGHWPGVSHVTTRPEAPIGTSKSSTTYTPRCDHRAHPPLAKPPARAGGFGYLVLTTLLVADERLVGTGGFSSPRRPACRRCHAHSPRARRVRRDPC